MKARVAEQPVPAEARRIDASQARKLISEVESRAVPAPEARQAVLKPVFGDVPAPMDLGHLDMPGPTGEQNHLSFHARGVVLCLGPDAASARVQAATALSQGNRVVVIAEGAEPALAEAIRAGLPVVAMNGLLAPEALVELNGFEAVVSVAEPALLKRYRQALAQRDGALLPLITEQALDQRFVLERHLCIDTTAAGGNASLIASAE
jgi:RHH-type proline utilization regulon transcriptional repressor/proline dehydrogenase/delta 1-pyrroline-5-carboxylate dehydrogenase